MISSGPGAGGVAEPIGANPAAAPADPPLPRFPIDVATPDIAAWIEGNIGIAGVTSIESGRPGPHVCITALTHGNEIAGAVVLDRLLRAWRVGTGPNPRRGRLTLAFVNLAAFARFDPANPTMSRFADEDFNRLWEPSLLDGSRRSSELDRARVLRPLIDDVDVLLDLHSMLWPSDPLILCGPSDRGRALALGIGTPALVVADHGHTTGPRLIDYPRFTDPARSARAVLVEAGQHWQAATIDTAQAAVTGLLRHLRLVDAPAPASTCRVAEVTETITAGARPFSFVQPYRGGSVVPRAGTLIGHDGTREVRTQYDDCLLVMPSLRPSRGHTVIRLARFV